MNNDEAAIAALIGPWTKPGETIVQGVQNVVELLHENAELNSTLVMRAAIPDYLPMTTREALDHIKALKDALNSAGEWIVNAEIAVEPGWAGSQSHILRRIEAALEGGDA